MGTDKKEDEDMDKELVHKELSEAIIMEQFLGLLRKELEQALDNDERVKIR